MTTKLIQGAPAIQKAITSIKGRGKTLDADIQHAGLSILAHAAEHGDTTLADALLGAMPKGSRKLALVEWMLAFGQVAKLNPKDKDDAMRIRAGAVFKCDRTRTLDLPAAEAKPWTEFKKEADVATAFDAQGAVQSLLARLKKAKKAGMTIENKTQAIAEVQALLDVLGA